MASYSIILPNYTSSEYSGKASPTFSHANANFDHCRPYKESISKEMNNDNDLNLHLHDQMSGWRRYCLNIVSGFSTNLIKIYGFWAYRLPVPISQSP